MPFQAMMSANSIGRGWAWPQAVTAPAETNRNRQRDRMVVERCLLIGVPFVVRVKTEYTDHSSRMPPRLCPNGNEIKLVRTIRCFRARVEISYGELTIWPTRSFSFRCFSFRSSASDICGSRQLSRMPTWWTHWMVHVGAHHFSVLYSRLKSSHVYS